MLPEGVPFRFDAPRAIQEKLITDAHSAFMEKKILLAHAETGLGKTDASLSAAIGAMLKLEPQKTILFLTPKNVQHQIALEVLRGLNSKFDLKLRVVDLVGKKHMCADESVAQKEGRGFYEMCSKKKRFEACTFYGNSKGYDLAGREKAKMGKVEFVRFMHGIFSSEEIKEEAESFQLGLTPFGLCPYEAALELAKKANVIIADYFHIFSPGVAEQILPKLGKKPEDIILIVDEAHNLPERVRGLLSTSLSTFNLRKAKEEALFLDQKVLAEQLSELEKVIQQFGESKLTSTKEREVTLKMQDLTSAVKESIPHLEEMALDCERFGVDYLEKSQRDSATLINVGEFLDAWAQEIEGQVRVLKKWGSNNNDFSLSLKGLDPSPITHKILSQVHAALLMSGTLHPLEMYADVLGIPKDRVRLQQYASPFNPKNRLNIIVPTVTTQYTSRNDNEYDKIAAHACEIVNAIPGNSIVFFPSFAMLDIIGNRMVEKIPRHVLRQREGMSITETQQLLQEFRGHAQAFGCVLLACASGSMAEGLDFPGNQLLAAVIVGIPLAEMNLETQALVQYYDYKFKQGWHYGYIFPAMGKAIQASGRVIRTPEDQGIVVFLDKRYAWDNYKNCLPPTQEFVVTSTPLEDVKRFWKERPGS